MKLLDEKVKLTISELHEFLSKPNVGQNYYHDPIEKIHELLKADKLKKSIFRQFDYLSIWYGDQFIYNGLTHSKYSTHETKNASNGYETLVISNILAQQYPENPPILLFDKVMYWLANCVVQKWYRESEELISIINEGLTSIFLKGGLKHKTAAWFILRVSNLAFTKDLNYSALNYPGDMNVYQTVLDFWNSEDLLLVDELVTQLCDFHLKNSVFGNKNSDDDLLIEFSRPVEFLHVYEVLCWLNVREMKGIDNPSSFSHPLMQLPINNIKATTAAIENSELFVRVKQKLETQN